MSEEPKQSNNQEPSESSYHEGANDIENGATSIPKEENCIEVLSESIPIQKSNESECVISSDLNCNGNSPHNDQFIIVTVKGNDTKADQNILPDNIAIQSDSVIKSKSPSSTVIPLKPNTDTELPLYNIIDVQPHPNPDMTDGLPTFEAEMNPKNQSKTVKTLAFICLPFYILFYEVPLFIYQTLLWTGKLVQRGTIAAVAFMRRMVSLILRGIYAVFYFIFVTCIFNPILYISRMTFTYILVPIGNLIVAIFVGIGQILSWVWRSIFIPIFGFFYMVYRGIIYGMVSSAMFIYNYILAPTGRGIAFICTMIYRGIEFCCIQIYRGISFIISSIYRGICVASLFAYQYFLYPIGKVLYAIGSGIFFVLFQIYMGLYFVATSIYEAIAFVCYHIFRLLSIAFWNIFLGFVFVVKAVFKGIVFLVSGIFQGINFVFQSIFTGIMFVIMGIYNSFCAIGNFVINFILTPIWNGLKYLGNGFYILCSNVFNTCAYIFKYFIALPIYNWILLPIWNYVLVPIYQGLAFLFKSIADFVKMIGRIISGIVSSMLSYFKSLYNAASQIVKSLVQSIRSKFSAIYASINESRAKVAQSLRSTLSEFKAAFRR